MKRTTIAILAGLGLMTGIAVAATPALRGPMAAMDADHNGSISAEEIKTFQDQKFKEADTNGDGVIDAAEYQAMIEKMRQQRIQARFQKMDTNGDGKLSETELTAHLDQRLSKCDSNGDGNLSADELKNCHHGHKGHHGMRGEQGDGPDMDHGMSGPDNGAQPAAAQ